MLKLLVAKQLRVYGLIEVLNNTVGTFLPPPPPFFFALPWRMEWKCVGLYNYVVSRLILSSNVCLKEDSLCKANHRVFDTPTLSPLPTTNNPKRILAMNCQVAVTLV